MMRVGIHQSRINDTIGGSKVLNCTWKPKSGRQTVTQQSFPTTVRAATSPSSEPVEDLWQIPDRHKWYEAKFAADDQPDWQPATFVSSRDLEQPGVRAVTLNIEISRELVPLRNAYKHVGQYASVRMNGGKEFLVPPMTPPFTPADIQQSLLKVRGDLAADEMKIETEEISERAEITLFVSRESAPELYDANNTDLFEMGPFEGDGIDLKGGICAVFRYPAVVLFVEGDGIATARALVQANDRGLQPYLRDVVKVYYKAPNKASICFKNEFEAWSSEHAVDVLTSTRDTFQEMFDNDQTLVYEPEATAAIILTGRDNAEAEEEACEACKAAEINLVVLQSVEQVPTQYI